MPLNPVNPNGNMYKSLGPGVPPMVATWNPVGGCTNECVYCWTRKRGLDMTPRFRESYLKDDLSECGEGTIFVGSVADIGCPEIQEDWILRVLEHVASYPKNWYLWQSKSPSRFVGLLETYRDQFPSHSIFATTMETNLSGDMYRKITGCRAEDAWERASSMKKITGYVKMVTVEPIIQCNPVGLVDLIEHAEVGVVTIGANSMYKKCPLPEPSGDQVWELIYLLSLGGKVTSVVIKSNLKRLVGDELYRAILWYLRAKFGGYDRVRNPGPGSLQPSLL